MINIKQISTEALSRRLGERESERAIHENRIKALDYEISAIKREQALRKIQECCGGAYSHRDTCAVGRELARVANLACGWCGRPFKPHGKYCDYCPVVSTYDGP